MAALCGVNVDRTISLTFVLGAALAAVAGLMFLVYYGVIDFYRRLRRRHQGLHCRGAGRHRLPAGRDAGRACHRADRGFWAGYFSAQYKDVAAFSILAIVLIFLPSGLLGRPEVEKV